MSLISEELNKRKIKTEPAWKQKLRKVGRIVKKDTKEMYGIAKKHYPAIKRALGRTGKVSYAIAGGLSPISKKRVSRNRKKRKRRQTVIILRR